MATPPPVDVSVVICVRNAESTLRAQLNALAEQQAAPSFEVLIVDNGSEDGSAAVAHAWIESGIGSAARARVVDASSSVGICHARNEGARAARADVLAFCDADDLVTPTWVKAIIDAVGHGHEFITGRIYGMDGEGEPRPEILRDSRDLVPGRRGSVTDIPYAWGCNFAIRRGAFAIAGGFDEALPPYGCDDIELGIRAFQRGIRLQYVPDMAIHYRRRAGWRNRARREFRVGIAQACLWARHPEVYGVLPAARQLAPALVSRPIEAMVNAAPPAKERLLEALLAFCSALGALVGLRRWVDGGLLRPPELMDRVLLDDEPVVNPEARRAKGASSATTARGAPGAGPAR